MYFYIFAFYYWCKFFNLQNFRFEIFSCKAPWAYGYGAIEILIIIILSNALHNTWTRTAQFAWVWRYIPPPPKKKNSSFCMQHCCFELMLALPIQYLTSIIQHCTFTIQHSCLKIQYSTSLIQHCALTVQRLYFKYYLHATFVCVFYLCSIDQKMSLLTPFFRPGV